MKIIAIDLVQAPIVQATQMAAAVADRQHLKSCARPVVSSNNREQRIHHPCPTYGVNVCRVLSSMTALIAAEFGRDLIASRHVKTAVTRKPDVFSSKSPRASFSICYPFAS